MPACTAAGAPFDKSKVKVYWLGLDGGSGSGVGQAPVTSLTDANNQVNQLFQ